MSDDDKKDDEPGAKVIRLVDKRVDNASAELEQEAARIQAPMAAFKAFAARGIAKGVASYAIIAVDQEGNAEIGWHTGEKGLALVGGLEIAKAHIITEAVKSKAPQ